MRGVGAECDEGFGGWKETVEGLRVNGGCILDFWSLLNEILSSPSFLFISVPALRRLNIPPLPDTDARQE